jgi:alkanesulfonate monooxygenase SsuD/methylene tetrahydromethanopterin reductase-like flavin-dependent oxidoreductase (luciferase family)
MVKVILQLYPQIPTKDEQERIDLRPIGRNADLYQKVIREWAEIIQWCDARDVWGAASPEHHFHSEGYEVCPNPTLLSAYWAAITKNIRVGQLGFVMSAQNPLRVAEDAAILDHLAEGRSFVGFARGYQDRWTNIMGQHLGTRASHSDGSADDKLNRDIFEEQVEMVLKAWTEESIDHNSDLWQIPYPYDKGIDSWFMKERTAVLGAPGEVDENLNVRRISVVPSTYQKPHPPVFVASNASVETVSYAGRKGFIPNYFAPLGVTTGHNQAYMDAAREAGRPVASGQMQCSCRWMQIGENEQDSRRALAAHDADIWKNFYVPTLNAISGSKKKFRTEGSPEDFVDDIAGSGLWFHGDIHKVKDQMVEEWKRVPSEYLTLIYHFAQMPKEAVLYNLDRFLTEIKPDLDEITEKAHRGSEVGVPAS